MLRLLAGATVVGLALAAVAMLATQRLTAQPTPDPVVTGVAALAQTSFADGVALAAPAVVNIYADRLMLQPSAIVPRDPAFQRFAGGALVPARLIHRQVLGSGVILGPDGLIVTNFHVIRNADKVNVALWDGRVTAAELIGFDEETDLAVLKIPYEALPTLDTPATPLRVGDVVLAIGNPLGLGKTVTMGIVSATGRSDLNVSFYETLIQTDAAINQGNSGGALINPDGEIVGINTASTGAANVEGIGFAIPIETVREVANALINDGVVVRGWLGTILSDGVIQSRRQAGGQPGVTVLGVYEGAPAQSAGIRAGDYITRIGGQTLGDLVSTYRLIADTTPGTEVAVEYWRGGERLETTVTLIQRPQLAQQSG